MAELALRINQKISPEPTNITGTLNEISAVLDASISGFEMSSMPPASINLPNTKSSLLLVLLIVDADRTPVPEWKMPLRMPWIPVSPRAYDKALYEEKCSALFEHVYESFSAA